jgi:hypothetical protein
VVVATVTAVVVAVVLALVIEAIGCAPHHAIDLTRFPVEVVLHAEARDERLIAVALEHDPLGREQPHEDKLGPVVVTAGEASAAVAMAPLLLHARRADEEAQLGDLARLRLEVAYSDATGSVQVHVELEAHHLLESAVDQAGVLIARIARLAAEEDEHLYDVEVDEVEVVAALTLAVEREVEARGACVPAVTRGPSIGAPSVSTSSIVRRR